MAHSGSRRQPGVVRPGREVGQDVPGACREGLPNGSVTCSPAASSAQGLLSCPHPFSPQARNPTREKTAEQKAPQ